MMSRQQQSILNYMGKDMTTVKVGKRNSFSGSSVKKISTYSSKCTYILVDSWEYKVRREATNKNTMAYCEERESPRS